MRLTKQLKLAILDNAVIASGLPERIKKLQTRTAAVAEEIRVAHYGGQEGLDRVVRVSDQIKELYLTLPDHARGHYPPNLYERNNITIRPNDSEHGKINFYYGGYPSEYYRNGSSYEDDQYEKRLVKGVTHTDKPSPRCGRYMAGKFPKALCTKAKKVSDQWKQVEAELADLWASVSGALEAVNTVKQLLEVWPEAEKLLPPAEQKAHLPAVPTDKLNKLLKL